MKLLRRLLKQSTVTALLLSVLGWAVFKWTIAPGPNQLHADGNGSFEIVWVVASAEPDNPYGAFLVPITILGIERSFYMR